MTKKEEHSSIPTLHLCNGFLGGVGKSTLARLFCERFIKLGRLFTLIDADTNYNVARAYDRGY
jgi:polynucleotide 5'-kinase involved in rRNA processing